MQDDGFLWFPEQDDRPAAFAEVTGWMALGGTRRSISCVLPVRDHRARLQALVPVLADALIDAGQPWEILVVDQGSVDGSFEAMRGWTALPGYRVARSRAGCARGAAISAGLRAARGECVLVVDPDLRQARRLVRDALAHWSDGARLIAGNDTESAQVLLHENPDSMPPLPPDAPSPLAGFDIRRGGMVLLDRGVLAEIMG